MAMTFKSPEAIIGEPLKGIRVIKLKFRGTAVYYAIDDEEGFSRGESEWYKMRSRFASANLPPLGVIRKLCNRYGQRISKEVFENTDEFRKLLRKNFRSYDSSSNTTGVWEEYWVKI